MVMEDVLKRNFSMEFVSKMQNAMITSSFKYGDVDERCGRNAIKNLDKALKAFIEDGNIEHLVDVANYAMLRYMFPQGNEGYKATDSDGSTHITYKTIYDWLRDDMIGDIE